MQISLSDQSCFVFVDRSIFVKFLFETPAATYCFFSIFNFVNLIGVLFLIFSISTSIAVIQCCLSFEFMASSNVVGNPSTTISSVDTCCTSLTSPVATHSLRKKCLMAMCLMPLARQCNIDTCLIVLVDCCRLPNSSSSCRVQMIAVAPLQVINYFASVWPCNGLLKLRAPDNGTLVNHKNIPGSWFSSIFVAGPVCERQ